MLSDECIADQVPFEKLPEGWAWARLGSVFNMQAGKNIKASLLSDEQTKKAPYPCFGGNGVRGFVAKPNAKGDHPIIGRQGALCGNVKRATGEFYATEHAVVVACFSNTNIAWARCFLTALNLNRYATATAQPGLAVSKISDVLIPIPPLPEQHRIVERMNGLMSLAEDYGKLEDAREKMDAELPGRLRKSVLQMAVQGKLVPQDPDDEPASALLASIREQRRELIKQKKMKAPKGGESVIFRGSDGRRYEKRMDVKGRESEPVCIEDEIPFEIPESWEWTRLENLADVSGGNTPKKEQLKPLGNIPYFKVADMNSIGNEREMVNAKLYVDDSYTGKTFPAGTIIYPKNGGAVLTNKRRMLVKESVVDLNTGSCTPYLEDCLNYLRLFFETIDFKEFYKGTAVTTVNGSLVKELLVPLPSLTEQSRIVKRLEILQNIIV